MKVLVVANHNKGEFSAFVTDQINALKQLGIEIETYGKVGSGIWGYLRNIKGLIRKIHSFKPELIHAHYGLCGLLSNFQRQIPVVTTYHGSDIHSGGWLLNLSRISMHLSAYNIFVSKSLYEQSEYKNDNASILSCGVDLDKIREIPRSEARRLLGIDDQKIIGLFSSNFDNQIKNASLAKAAIKMIPNVQLMELKGYTREEVAILMNACDFQLTTSFRESGPLVVKEAMACGTPVVSVDVGDVKDVFGEATGCYIAERDPSDIAEKIELALAYKGKTDGRQRIINLKLDNKEVAKSIVKIYQKVLRSH